MKNYINTSIQVDRFFEQGPNPMFIIEQESYRILAANEMAVSVFGYTQEELLSMYMVDLTLPESAEASLKQKTAPKHEYFTGLRKLRKKSGSAIYVKNFTQLIDCQDYKAIYISAAEVQDEYLETLRVAQLEKEIDNREAYLNAMTHSDQSYLIRINLGCNYTFVNQAFCKRLGYKKNEVVGQAFLPSILMEDQHKVRKKIEESIGKPGQTLNLKFRKLDRRGITHIISWDLVSITNADGVVVELQFLGQDVSYEQFYYQQLSSTKDLLDNILSTVDMVWSLETKNFNVLFVNEACEKITGYTEQDFYNNGLLWINMIHHEDQEEVKRKLLQLMKISQTEVEYRIRHKDGSIRHLRLKAVLSRDKLGTPISIVGTSVDITAEKKSVRLLKEREKFIDHILNTIPGTVYIHWPQEEKTHFLNLGVLKLLEIEEQGYSGVPENIVTDLCHPDDQEMLQQHYDEIIEEASLSSIYNEVIKINKAKDVKWLMLSEVVLRQEDHEVLGILGIATDITALRKRKVELQKISEKLALAIHISHLGICNFYPSLEQVWLDPPTKMMLNEENDMISTKSFIERIEPAFQDEISDLIFKKDIAHTEKVSFAYTQANGKKNYLKMVFSDSKENDVETVVGVIFDETEEKEYEQRLREKDAEISRTNQQVVEYKLMALQSVMNPHFLFNSLNSIQFLIAKRQREEALKYLTLFSELLRKVIDSAVSGRILLNEEVELLHHYLQLEKLRFEDKFDFSIHVDQSVNIRKIGIPPLLIQPFVENAIIHGINNKEGKGKLSIYIQQENSSLRCIIEDDGIGREKALSIKESKGINHTSVGVMLTKERLQIVNKKHPVTVDIEDLYDHQGEACGTRVHVSIEID